MGEVGGGGCDGLVRAIVEDTTKTPTRWKETIWKMKLIVPDELNVGMIL